MSIIAYLIQPHNPLKMPDSDKIPNPCGIKWQGPVLSGKRSLDILSRDSNGAVSRRSHIIKQRATVVGPNRSVIT
jgi:hypothetical protein